MGTGIGLRWRLAALPSILGIFLLAGSANASAVSTVRATKTTTYLGGTTSSPTPMTGNLSLSATTAGTTYILVDAFQAMPTGNGGANNDRYYQGTYTISFSNCTGGTATGSVETIGSGGIYPGGPPPINTSPPSYFASGNSVSCDYSIAFSGTGPAPAGTIVSGVRNDVWVLVDGTLVSETAGPQVSPPFGSPPPVVPEAGLPILLPLAGLLLLGIVVVARRRRLASG